VRASAAAARPRGQHVPARRSDSGARLGSRRGPPPAGRGRGQPQWCAGCHCAEALGIVTATDIDRGQTILRGDEVTMSVSQQGEPGGLALIPNGVASRPGGR